MKYFCLRSEVCKLIVNSHHPIVYIYVLGTIYVVFNTFLMRYTMLDELVTVILTFYSLNYLHIYKRKEVITTFSVLLFYLFYSLILKVNQPIAAFYDFAIFLKPFLCFYICSGLKVKVPKETKKLLKYFYLLLAVYLILISPYISQLYSNTAAYYSPCIICAVSYLYFSDREKKDWVIALMILTPGLLSIRAKFFTIYLLFIFIAFFLKDRIKVNLKWVIIFLLLATVSIYVSWEKFSHYFIDADEDVARTAFYIHSFNVLKDYFPFGPGFGTYGTEAAAKFYSPLYYKYGLYLVWGLRDIDYGGTGHDFLKDTFYPVLAQFGIVGIFLFIFFWYRRWTEALLLNIENYKIFIFILFVELIQNIAANSFSGPLGIPLMMMMGMLVNDRSSKFNKNVKQIQR